MALQFNPPNWFTSPQAGAHSLSSQRPFPPARKKAGDRRPFEPIDVGICYAQTAIKRFGRDAKTAIRDRERVSQGANPHGIEMPFTWPSGDPDRVPLNTSSNSIYRLVPSMQCYRNNLTTLSQIYNLYFVAYQGHIFVYVPQSILRQRVSREPELELYAKPSAVSREIGGFLDRANPHTINHLITGMLGNEEIVVAAFDDGDVVAYYVREVADCIFGKSSRPRCVPNSHKRVRVSRTPRPLFQENVGHSAWGLAVHGKSRLLAVSSNRCEITVFAFSLISCWRASRRTGQSCDCCPRCAGGDFEVPRRERNWRIVIVLRSDAANIPNISFLDDERGQATMICAVDIKGALWFADIWTTCQPATRLERTDDVDIRSDESWPAISRGWGILPIPTNEFLVVDELDQLTGKRAELMDFPLTQQINGRPMLKMRACVRDIPNNPNFDLDDNGVPLPQLAPEFGEMIPGVPLNLADLGPSDPSEAGDANDSEEEYQWEAQEPTPGVGTGNFTPGIYQGSSEHTWGANGEIQQVVLWDVGETADDAELGEEVPDQGGENFEEEDHEEEEELGPSEEEDFEIEDDEQGGGGGVPQLQGMAAGAAIAALMEQDLEEEEQEQQGQLVEEPEELTQEPEAHLHYSPAESIANGLDGPHGADDALAQFRQRMHELEEAMHRQEKLRRSKSRGRGERGERGERKGDVVAPWKVDMAFFPHNGRVQTVPNRTAAALARFLKRPIEFNEHVRREQLERGWQRVEQISQRYRYLRGYEKDVELLSLTPDVSECSMLFPDVLRSGLTARSDGDVWPHFRATSRVSMMARVPELSLVIVGSPVGRVLLMTPTKLRGNSNSKGAYDPSTSPSTQGRWGSYVKHGLRLEWVLPTAWEEAVHRPRSRMRPLHGMAIGPVQRDRVRLYGPGEEVNEAAVGRRYRLMLHYRDHSILSYELTRDTETGKLCIF